MRPIIYKDTQDNFHTIHITYECPPIPYRHMDYTAVTDDYDGAPDAGPQHLGQGATSKDAIDDLINQIEESLPL